MLAGLSHVLSSVFQLYSAQYWPQRIVALQGAGGFSGACLWQASADFGSLCLRRWPTGHPDLQQLQFIHSVLGHVEQQGFGALPVPLASRDGNTFVLVDGSFWELTRWLAGQADYDTRRDPQKLVSAFEALASFHRAAKSFPRSPLDRAVSPGIRQRCTQLSELHRGGFGTITTAVQRTAATGLRRRGMRLLELFRCLSPEVAVQLAGASQRPVQLQPCIRDIWHDHVLFTGSRVSGLVDFGAMRIDNVACDVARLLGSTAGDLPDDRRLAMESYQAIRPLSHDEQLLVEVFDTSSVLLSGINWLQWICVDGRRFHDGRRVLERLDKIIIRLENAAQGHGPSEPS